METRRPSWVQRRMGTEAEEEEKDSEWAAAAVDAGDGRGARQRTPGLVAIGASTVRGRNRLHWTSEVVAAGLGDLWLCLADEVEQ